MKKGHLAGLSIRTGVVRSATVGYLLAGDPHKERQDVLHTRVFKWDSGAFRDGNLNFTASSCCLVANPQFALVMLASEGEYGISPETAPLAGNVFVNSEPRPKKPRYGSLRSVSDIGGKAYAVGLRGMVYRLDQFTHWTRIDEGLPENFDIQAIDGFSEDEIYAVGFRGEVWHFSGRKWTQYEPPTNVNLTCVKCAADGNVYIGGHDGILIRGTKTTWEIIENEDLSYDIWDLEWFDGKLYLSTMTALYRLNGDELEPVSFGKDSPKTCYHLSAVKGVMWSIGERDVMSFDGKTWTRIV
jgi:hypothetical protein